MKKRMKLDLSSDRLLGIASDLVDEHNYIGALKMLNKNSELNFNDEFSYMLYAEIFDDIGLYESCVNSWFKFLDCAPEEEDFSEAYEGLAVAYMNLGSEHFSAYYYNKLLMDNEGLTADERGEIIDSFLSREREPLKFVYPPQLADYSDVIADGVDKMKSGEFDDAIEEFDKVDERNSAFLSARNYIAMCNIINDKYEEAEEECLLILDKNPNDVQALTTLAAVKSGQKKYDESRKVAKKLLSLGVTSNDEIYKIATVCCENKMHEEAFWLFCKLENELAYDSSVLFFKAVSAFNCGKYEQCFDAFDKLLTIYPNAVTARYHYHNATEWAKSGSPAEMSYFYRMPQSERESTLKILTALSRLSEKQMDKIFDAVDVTDCILWCFDEGEIGGEELQLLASVCAVKARLDGLICDILLNAFLPDSLKIKVLTLLCERNEDNFFGVVICHIHKRITFRHLNLGRLKRKHFVSAYARLTAHFAIIDDNYGELFALAAEEIYARLKEENRLAAAADTDALTAAVYIQSGVNESHIVNDGISKFFDVTDERIENILGGV